MKYVFLLAARSAWNRRLTLGMTLIAVTLSPVFNPAAVAGGGDAKVSSV